MIPLVSIIVPCYNQSKYLSDALLSVQQQTFLNWECIIVNDGSTDETMAVSARFYNVDSRFQYMEKKNAGLSAARNSGINSAKGKFILPLDADDKIGVEYISNAIAIFERSKNTKLVYCKAEMFGYKNQFWQLSNFRFKKLLRKNLIFCSCIYKRVDCLRIGGYDETMKSGYEDWEFLIRFCSRVKGKVQRLDYIGFFYRTKEVSMVQNLDADFQMKNLVVRYIQNKHQSLYKKNKMQIWWNRVVHKIVLR